MSTTTEQTTQPDAAQRGIFDAFATTIVAAGQSAMTGALTGALNGAIGGLAPNAGSREVSAGPDAADAEAMKQFHSEFIGGTVTVTLVGRNGGVTRSFPLQQAQNHDRGIGFSISIP
jgi:hypothetical protein